MRKEKFEVIDSSANMGDLYSPFVLFPSLFQDHFARLACPHRVVRVACLCVVGSLVHCRDAFGRWRTIAQCVVRPDRVVVNAPLRDQGLRLPPNLEQFSEKQRAIEAGV